jgi:mono/diheme cytochrome c family protein
MSRIPLPRCLLGNAECEVRNVESVTTRRAGGLRKSTGWGHPAARAPEARCRKARGASPGYASRPQQSPVRAKHPASPLQGIIFGNVSVPGLTPWVFLHRPFRASCGEIRSLAACRPLPSLQISLAQRSHFESHRQRRWFALTQISEQRSLYSAFRIPHCALVKIPTALIQLLLFAVFALMWCGCAPNMSEQPKYKSLAESKFFPDSRTARPVIKDTVARGYLRSNESLYQGKANGALIARIPVPVTKQVLERGHERFDIYCSPCHGRVGDGGGMVSQRGFRRPPSYHTDRLREQSDGHYYDVITNGFGAMASYASRIPPGDRWEIVAYIRALQLSQAARIDDVPPAQRQTLDEATK